MSSQTGAPPTYSMDLLKPAHLPVVDTTTHRANALGMQLGSDFADNSWNPPQESPCNDVPSYPLACWRP